MSAAGSSNSDPSAAKAADSVCVLDFPPKEHGMLFSGPMVRALIAGTKTQTRRRLTRGNSVLDWDGGPLKKWPGLDLAGVIRADYPRAFGPEVNGGCEGAPRGVASLCAFATGLPGYEPGERTCHRIYPRVRPGERIWVRETWRPAMEGYSSYVEYAAGGDTKRVDPDLYKGLKKIALRFPGARKEIQSENWHPSLLIPRWASRLILGVTAVRTERLNDISEADARAEGLSTLTKDGGQTWKFGIPDRDGRPGEDDDGWHWSEWNVDPRKAYRLLWESINGPGSWDANPWVWVIEFRRQS